MDDFNNVEGREIYTPALPKAESLEESKYSPPDPDPEEISPRRLPPVALTFPQQASHDQTDSDKNNVSINMTALPPISSHGNKVAPASEEVVQRSELRQRSAGSLGDTMAQQYTPGLWQSTAVKHDLIIGGKFHMYF